MRLPDAEARSLMRILWLINRYWPAIGGAELHSQQTVAELAARGHDVTVVTHWNDNRTDWLRGTTISAPRRTLHYRDPAGVGVVRLGYGPLRRARTILPAATYYLRQPAAASALATLIERDLRAACGDGWDVVHGVRTGREPLFLAGERFARRLGVPYVFAPLHHPRWTRRRYRVYLDLYRRADAVIALTEHERRLYTELGVAPQRIHVTGAGPVLPPAADGARFRARLGIGEAPLVLFLGQKYPYKGYEQVLRAAGLVWHDQPEAVFCFVGPRTSSSRRAFARARDRRVIELDAVDLQAKGDALAACDVFCLPSQQESFGGVFTEAWSYARPVIGRDIPAVREVVTDGEDGFLLGTSSPSELAAVITRLLGDGPLRERLGATGQAKVRAAHTWPHVADRLEHAYQHAAAAAVRTPTEP